jgi:hypothetical protein
MTKKTFYFILLLIFCGAASPAFCISGLSFNAKVYSQNGIEQDTFKLFIAEFTTVILPHKETPGDMKTPAKYQFQRFFSEIFDLNKFDIYCDKLLYENDNFVVVSFDNYCPETRISEEHILCYDKSTKKIVGQLAAGMDDSKNKRHDFYTVSFDKQLIIGLSGKTNYKLNDAGVFVAAE